MRLLVIGASGLVGQHLWRYAVATGHDVTGTYNQRRRPGLVQLRVYSLEQVTSFFDEYQPEAVIYCAAWSWVDGCEGDSERAFRENCDFPAIAAQAAAANNATFAYISSSYVFDGVQGPYAEDAHPRPISTYGKSKFAGERAVMHKAGDRALIVRTMGVYGPEVEEKNFVYQVVKTLRSGQRMQVPNDQRGNATEALNFAVGVLALISCRAAGIWHVAGAEPELSRVNFARQIATSYELNTDLIDSVTTAQLMQHAPRPLHAGLVTTRASLHSTWKPAGWTPFTL